MENEESPDAAFPYFSIPNSKFLISKDAQLPLLSDPPYSARSPRNPAAGPQGAF